MIAQLRRTWRSLFRKDSPFDGAPPQAVEPKPALPAQVVEFDLPPHDPLLAYLLNVPNVLEVDRLQLDSPTLRRLKAEGVKVTVPLISQGELIGLLNLGARRSEQEFSSGDLRLLNTLAVQAAPALRVAQLARQQQAEARARERMAQELRVARVIQQTLLPKEVPELPGWRMAAHWQPARAVSGDFYDFIPFPDGQIGIVVADVTDKGVPAALVMATTRSILRAAAERLVSPGKVLEQANNTLCPDIPANMFVTCLYILLDPASGRLKYANAGHNLPYQRTGQGVAELRARGMPLGLMPEMDYEEKEAVLAPGDELLLYSDGFIEAHNPQGEMFGFPRLRDLLGSDLLSCEIIQCMVGELERFTGPNWEQEDDVTFVTITREGDRAGGPGRQEAPMNGKVENPEAWSRQDAFSLPSEPGNERQAMERIAQAVASSGLSTARIERLKTAVGEATMNAIEHGNQYQPDRPVEIEVWTSSEDVRVTIRDQGSRQEVPDLVEPDLDAKLQGLQPPRGWGLFLIKNMVDEMHIHAETTHHTVELIMHRKKEG